MSENIQYFQQICDWINDKYYGHKFNITVVPGRRFGDYSKAELNDAKITMFVCIDLEADINTYDQIKNMLHQIIMLYADNLEHIKVSSNRGVYLNKRYKQKAESIGCSVERHEKYGYRLSGLPTELMDYLESIHFNQFKIWMPVSDDDQRSLSSSTRKYICPCCGNSFRATKNLRVICADCDEQFVLAGE